MTCHAGSAPTPTSRNPHLLLLVFVMAAAVSCGRGEQGGASLPPSPTIVDVSLREYRIYHPQATAPAGRAVFRVANRGVREHQLLVIRIPNNVRSLKDQLQSSQRQPVEALEYLPNLQPGETTVFASDLSRGRYGLICFLVGDDGQTHALKGMNSELLVGKKQPTGERAPAPEA